MFCLAELTGGAEDVKLGVVEVRFDEGLNRLFRADLLVAHEDRNLDLGTLLHEPVRIVLDAGDFKREIGGLIWEVKYLGYMDAQRYGFQLVVHPKHMQLSADVSSRVFPETSRPAAALAVLEAAGLTAGHDFEVALQKSVSDYPTCPQVIQYQESDLTFVKRLFEYEGINFYLGVDGEDDKLIITDVRQPECAEGQLELVPRGGLVAAARSVHEFVIGAKFGSAAVRVRQDSGWDPSATFEHDTAIEGPGDGEVCIYGSGLADQADAERIARIRAEELACRKVVGKAISNYPSVRPGHRFEINGNWSSQSDGKYMIVSAVHELRRPASTAFGDRETPFEYRNSFEAVPASTSYRPARHTPWPRITGLMHAVVDAPENMQIPSFDDRTRYLLRLPFDQEEHEAGAASAAAEVLRPYAGHPSQTGNAGFQFPIATGSDVVWAGLDGDPDHPVVLGALPSSESPSPVPGLDTTVEYEMATRAGNTLKLHDWRTQGWDMVEQLSGGEQSDESADGSSTFHGGIRFFSPTDNSELALGEITRPAGILSADGGPNRGRGHRLYSFLNVEDTKEQVASAAELVLGEMCVDSTGQAVGQQLEEGLSVKTETTDPSDDKNKLVTRAVMGLLGSDGGKTFTEMLGDAIAQAAAGGLKGFADAVKGLWGGGGEEIFTGAHVDAVKLAASEDDGWETSLRLGHISAEGRGVRAFASPAGSAFCMHLADSHQGLQLATEGRSIVNGVGGTFFTCYSKMEDALSAAGELADFDHTYNSLIFEGVKTAVSQVKSQFGYDDDPGLLALGKALIKDLSSVASDIAGGLSNLEQDLGVFADGGIGFHSPGERLSVHGNTGVDLCGGRTFDAIGKDETVIVGITKGATVCSVEADAEVGAVAGDAILYGEARAEMGGKNKVLLTAGEVASRTKVELAPTAIELMHEQGMSGISFGPGQISVGKLAQTIEIEADSVTVNGKVFAAAALSGIAVKASSEIKLG